eukprot:1632431-Prymnesium_polylepis.1
MGRVRARALRYAPTLGGERLLSICLRSEVLAVAPGGCMCATCFAACAPHPASYTRAGHVCAWMTQSAVNHGRRLSLGGRGGRV